MQMQVAGKEEDAATGTREDGKDERFGSGGMGSKRSSYGSLVELRLSLSVHLLPLPLLLHLITSKRMTPPKKLRR